MWFSEHFTRVKLPRWAAEQSGDDQPPDLGQVSELVRNTLTSEYDIYPPNLSTEINQDGSIKITAVNPTTGLNLQVTLQNLAGDLIHPSGQMTGVVPAEGGVPSGGEGGVAGGVPGALAGPPPGGASGTDSTGGGLVVRLSTSYRVLRVAVYSEEVPPAPGATPIPANHVRLYHYISSYKGGQGSESQEQMAENLKRGGIDISKARGSTYGEPNVVWASTKPPGRHKVFAEFDIHKDDPRWGIGRPRTPDKVDWLNKGNIDVTFGDSIKPEEIIAVHLPWHHTYRYLKEHNMFPEVLNGDYDHLLDNPEWDEAKAINYIKSHHGYIQDY